MPNEPRPYFEIWKSGPLIVFSFFDGNNIYNSNTIESVHDLTEHAKSCGYTEVTFEKGRESGNQIWKFYQPEEIKQ